MPSWLGNRWDHLWRSTCMSWDTRLLTGYSVQYTCISFTMKALAAAASELYWSNIMVTLYEIMLWPRYGYLMVMLWLLCQPGENNVSAFPMAPWVFFQPLSSSLAYPGLNKQCEQQDNWHREQDQLDRHCSPWWLYQFTFPSTVREVSLFSTSSPTLIYWFLMTAV